MSKETEVFNDWETMDQLDLIFYGIDFQGFRSNVPQPHSDSLGKPDQQQPSKEPDVLSRGGRIRSLDGEII